MNYLKNAIGFESDLLPFSDVSDSLVWGISMTSKKKFIILTLLGLSSVYLFYLNRVVTRLFLKFQLQSQVLVKVLVSNFDVHSTFLCSLTQC